ncbi:S-adenosylmethionine decarboxylase related protein [Schinkia sp. CFF1]
MGDEEVVISIFGSAGGVARAVLSLLNKSATDPNDPLHPIIGKSKLHLFDKKKKNLQYYEEICPDLCNRISLYQCDFLDLHRVRHHLYATQTTLLIDLSWADTIDMIAICNDLGISYVNTALEIVDVDDDESLEGFTLIERFSRFSYVKDTFTNMKGITCSGMNPGVVQWMAHTLMTLHPNEKPLACYIVERDTTFFKDPTFVQPKTIYSTWSPECFLDEALLNFPMFVKEQVPVFLYNNVYDKEFKVTLGDIQFYGCLMPHEEVLSLGTLYNMETGFIYKVNDYTTQSIIENLDVADELWNWDFKVLDPKEAELEGQDMVGVLLVYEDKERFIYNVMDNDSTNKRFGINGTYLQVACGVYAATCTLLLETIPYGVFFVEELLKTVPDIDYGKYVKQYMPDFVIGENKNSDGLLLNRMRNINP